MSRKNKPCGCVGIDLARAARDAERRAFDERDDAVGSSRCSRSRSSSTAGASRSTLAGLRTPLLRRPRPVHASRYPAARCVSRSSRRCGSRFRRRATAGSSSWCRCSPTASSTPATTSRCSRRGGSRTKADARVADAGAARPARARQPVVRRATTRSRRTSRSTGSTSCTTTPASSGRSAARCCAAIRRSCTRCTGRGPSRTALLYALVAHARASRRDQRRAARRQPRRAVRRHRAQRHRPRRATRTRARRNDSLVYIGRANPDKGPNEAITIARRAGLAAAHDPQARRAARARVLRARGRTAARVRRRAATRTSPTPRRSSCSAGRARMVFPIRWPEPFGLVMVEAMACGTPVRHDELGRRARARRRRRHRIPPRQRRRPRRGGRPRRTSSIPAACRSRVEERFSAEAMVRGYEAAVRAGPAAILTNRPPGFPLRP